jgi:hypothetical protein
VVSEPTRRTHLPLKRLLGLGLQILAQSGGVGGAQQLARGLALLYGITSLGLGGIGLGSVRLAAVPPAGSNGQRLS